MLLIKLVKSAMFKDETISVWATKGHGGAGDSKQPVDYQTGPLERGEKDVV